MLYSRKGTRALSVAAGVVLVVSGGVYVALSILSAPGTVADGTSPPAFDAGPDVDRGALARHARGTRLLVRGVDERAPRADGRLFEITAGGGATRVGKLVCKRVHATPKGPGLCLAVESNGSFYEGIIFDEDYEAVDRFPVKGVPDRARVSPDGRYGAFTAFDARGSQGYFGTTGDFSTHTRIVDMRTGKRLLRLEDLELRRGGRSFDPRDVELWGVTFAREGRYYATVATGRDHYLIEGHVGSRRARVLRADVECPALSPDGTRLAYKRRIGNANRWRFHVLDLRTGRDTALAETRSIDDQPEWLGRDRVIYSDDEAVFAVPADGSGRPTRLMQRATSPVALAWD